MDKDAVNWLYDSNKIDHATWCNALRYIEGDYKDHKLCRIAYRRCWSKLQELED